MPAGAQEGCYSSTKLRDEAQSFIPVQIEFNSANLFWDLTLNKPYNDGGYENSRWVIQF